MAPGEFLMRSLHIGTNANAALRRRSLATCAEWSYFLLATNSAIAACMRSTVA